MLSQLLPYLLAQAVSRQRAKLCTEWKITCPEGREFEVNTSIKSWKNRIRENREGRKMSYGFQELRCIYILHSHHDYDAIQANWKILGPKHTIRPNMRNMKHCIFSV